jgi:sugar/nucleoside kinase (ribokinase family)
MTSFPPSAPRPEPLDVITFGEAMVMLIADDPGPLVQVRSFRKHVAGADSNVATGLARLGCRVGWMSRLGRDSFGQYIVACLQAEGVDCSQVVFDDRLATGFQLKERMVDGADPRVEYFRKNSAASRLSSADFNPRVFLAARHLHATGIPPALSPETRELSRHAITQMRLAGRTVSFDPNLRPSLWASQAQMIREINQLACLASWVMPGLAEGRLLTGRQQPEEIASFYLDHGVEEVVIKLGTQGSYYRTRHDAGFVEGFPVANVTDTVGAGDGFAAGCVSARLEGRDARQAARRGNFAGAQVVQAVGDSEGLPHRAEVVAMESGRPIRAA